MSTDTYELDSLFMEHCYQKVARSKTEEFYYLTGPSDGWRHTPLCLVAVKYRRVSAVGVEFDPLSNSQRLSLLERHGHALLGTVHVHPGHGPQANCPSGTDLATHRRFEIAGYRLIGLIFSRDGYLRAFSWQQRFCIRAYGKGLEQHDACLFRLVSVDNHSNGQAECARGVTRGLGKPRAGAGIQPERD